jgi:beta-galactosidase
MKIPSTLRQILWVVLSLFGLSLGRLHGLDLTPQGPTEELSSQRGQVVLSGVWGFSGDGVEANTIRVPSSWVANNGSLWFGGVCNKTLEQATYSRSVEIPAAWSGRKILLDLRRVSTDAEIFWDGKSVGKVGWPYGQVDLTPAAKPGSKGELKISVQAKTPEGEVWALMGYATEEKKKKALASRGLIGDVILASQPNGAVIAGVFIKPSVRKKALEVDVELEGFKAGACAFKARLLDEAGKEEKVFDTTAQVAGGPQSKVTLSFPWENPRLWDLDKPNIYTLVLEATPADAKAPVDAYPQMFGFRELWIEGRDFVLNGSKVRWRPTCLGADVGTEAAMEGLVQGAKGAGFNISQIWPEDAMEPGHANQWELWAEFASKKGWPIIGVLPKVGELALNKKDGVPIWDADPAAKKSLLDATTKEWARYRNYPSVLIWGTSGNLNNHFADQDPRYIGQQAKLSSVPQGAATEKIAREFMAAIKTMDPTRPVFVHAGSRLGDIFTVNHYLNLIPLQEREEWMSDYVRTGDVPYIGIEFGTPLNTNMNRGRTHFGGAHPTEPLMTEHCAAYLGNKAYELQPRDYRRNVRFGYTGKDWAGDWQQMQWIQSAPEPFQELQALFLKNTWRSWRTAGVTGGMIPWNAGNQIFLIKDKDKKAPATPFTPGKRGLFPDADKLCNTKLFDAEGGWIEKAAAKVLREVNAPLLAWVAGPASTADDPVAFTDKDHSFRSGQKVTKSAALLNDTRDAQPWSASWVVKADGKEVTKGEASGTLEPGTTVLSPIAFDAPAAAAGQKVQAQIELTAKIGATELKDTFPFRVFGAAPTTAIPSVTLFDPEGKTKAMLDGLGIQSTAWDGKPSQSVLVVGREALSKRHKLPGGMAEFVEAGGRLLIMPQEPDYFRGSTGLRVSRYVSRRVFPVDAAHPAVAGLDAEDLRDWAGAGTLLDPKPTYEPRTIPPYGWRWGNRGSVTSGAIEKPHSSGWRPILECEFDLAYSPLMELDFGKGRATLCTLDLEDQWKADPAAERLARQMLAHVAKAPLAPRLKAVIIGDADDQKFCKEILGIQAEAATSLPSAPALAVIGKNSGLSALALESFAQSGGNVVVLAQNKPGEEALGGGKLIPGKSFSGFIGALPTSPLTAGLSASDLRFRSDLDWFLFDKAPEVQAEGMLFVRSLGKGAIVQAQLDPRLVDAEKMPAFRFTRWRQTRALSQLLANQGASFGADVSVLKPSTSKISLVGPWKVKFITRLPNTTWDKPHEDPGISAEAKAAVAPAFDDSGWETWNLPAWYPPMDKENGEAVWRKTVDLPPEWEGQLLQLSAGRVKSYDTTFVNGQEVGTNGPAQDVWNKVRRYRVSADKVKGGKAVIAIRQFAPDTQGGVHGNVDEMFMKTLSADKKAQAYYPDYKEDFELADEPARYFRW